MNAQAKSKDALLAFVDIRYARWLRVCFYLGDSDHLSNSLVDWVRSVDLDKGRITMRYSPRRFIYMSAIYMSESKVSLPSPRVNLSNHMIGWFFALTSLGEDSNLLIGYHLVEEWRP